MGAPRTIREAAGISQMVMAVRAGVSEPTLRLYEANPAAVKDRRKREALDRVYAELRDSARASA